MLLALHLGRPEGPATSARSRSASASFNNAREALAIARECRNILGGNGITPEYP